MKATESRLTQKGQVTILDEIRARLGLKPRDRVRFEVEGDVIVLRPAGSILLTGYGAVTPTRKPEDWRAVREVVEQGIVDETRGEL